MNYLNPNKSDDAFILKREEAEAYLQRITDPPKLSRLTVSDFRQRFLSEKRGRLRLQIWIRAIAPEYSIPILSGFGPFLPIDMFS